MHERENEDGQEEDERQPAAPSREGTEKLGAPEEGVGRDELDGAPRVRFVSGGKPEGEQPEAHGDDDGRQREAEEADQVEGQGVGKGFAVRG